MVDPDGVNLPRSDYTAAKKAGKAVVIIAMVIAILGVLCYAHINNDKHSRTADVAPQQHSQIITIDTHGERS